MGLSFLGPARDQPWVTVERRDDRAMLCGSMTLTLEEIDALHAHVHQDDEAPKVEDKLPPWCPTFDELGRAKAMLRGIAKRAMRGWDAENWRDNMVVSLAQMAMDALGGGPVLKDDLDLDDDGGTSESSTAEDAEEQQRRTER